MSKKTPLLVITRALAILGVVASARLVFSDPLSAVAAPRGTNAFVYAHNGVRSFSIDWVGLTLGHTYEVQCSGDGRSWRRRTSILWSEPDPTAYWRSQFLMVPPTPTGLTVGELFRLADVTPNH